MIDVSEEHETRGNISRLLRYKRTVDELTCTDCGALDGYSTTFLTAAAKAGQNWSADWAELIPINEN